VQVPGDPVALLEEHEALLLTSAPRQHECQGRLSRQVGCHLALLEGQVRGPGGDERQHAEHVVGRLQREGQHVHRVSPSQVGKLLVALCRLPVSVAALDRAIPGK
jgi:hypothetical protein